MLQMHESGGLRRVSLKACSWSLRAQRVIRQCGMAQHADGCVRACVRACCRAGEGALSAARTQGFALGALQPCFLAVPLYSRDVSIRRQQPEFLHALHYVVHVVVVIVMQRCPGMLCIQRLAAAPHVELVLLLFRYQPCERRGAFEDLSAHAANNRAFEYAMTSSE